MAEQKPYRYRQDGWTPPRQIAFLHALREGCTLKEACRHVGLSVTSARRAKTRIPGFAEAWDFALEYRAPPLERAAFERAVNGWLEPMLYKGEVVAHRPRYSDAALKLLMDRRPETLRAPVATAPPASPTARASSPAPLERSSVDDLVTSLTAKLDAMDRRMRAQKRREMEAWADDMAARGLAP